MARMLKADKKRKRQAKVQAKKAHEEYLKKHCGLEGRFMLEITQDGGETWISPKLISRENPEMFATWGQVRAYCGKIAKLRTEGVPIIQGRIIDTVSGNIVWEVAPANQVKP